MLTSVTALLQVITDSSCINVNVLNIYKDVVSSQLSFDFFLQKLEQQLSTNTRRSFGFSSLRVKSRTVMIQIHRCVHVIKNVLFSLVITFSLSRFVLCLQKGSTVKTVDLHGEGASGLFHRRESHQEKVRNLLCQSDYHHAALCKHRHRYSHK